VEDFVTGTRAKGLGYADFDAAFRNWVKKRREFAKPAKADAESWIAQDDEAERKRQAYRQRVAAEMEAQRRADPHWAEKSRSVAHA
jgi:hypothetical protein